MPNIKNLRVYDFSGGLNEIAENFNLENNESPSCMNVVFDEQGALVKRSGYQKIIDEQLNDIKGLYEFYSRDGEKFLLCSADSSIYLADEVEETWGSLKSDLSNAKFSFTTFRDKCLMANGQDYLLEFDGENIEEDTDAPKGKYIVSHNNHLFLAGDPNNPNRLYFAYEKGTTGEMTWYIDPEHTEDGFNFIDVNSDDGDVITGITNHQGNLLIFKNNSIWILFGDHRNNFQLKNLQPTIGCIAPKSIVNIHNKIYFLYYDGIYTFDGANLDLISEKINHTVRDIQYYENCCGAVYNHNYFLAYPHQSTENNRILVYNYLHDSWTRFDSIESNVFANFDGSQDGKIDTRTLYFAGDNYVYEYGIGNSDDGDPIRMEHQTKYFNLQQQEVVKTFRRIMMDGLTDGNIKIDYDIDKGKKTGTLDLVGHERDGQFRWGESNWEDLNWHKTKRLELSKSMRGGTFGKAIKFIFRDNSIDPVVFYGFTLEIRARRVRWR